MGNDSSKNSIKDAVDEKVEQSKQHNMEEKQVDEGTALKPKSRFKVAKVEFKELPTEHENECKQEVGENHDTTGHCKVVVKPTGDDTGASPPMTPNHTDSYHLTYDTQMKTFGHNTLETLPHVDHYRNLLSATGAMKKRPTLLELHELEQGDGEGLITEGENNLLTDAPNGVIIEDGKPSQATGPKFGWVKGVLVRCLLNIYGVMLFLRLSWVVGQAGMGFATLIILLAGVVTTITSLSMSAICTNGQVKGGGAYFMISRSLGPEFGGAIGVIFSVANAVAIAMYVVGFAETIRDILKENDCLMVDEVNDVRIIGLITVILLLGLALLGMEWEAKAQLVLLGILLVAIVNFSIGSFIPPRESQSVRGFVGYKASILKENIGPDFRDGEGFFSMFSIFFPAATGILAGANISGDLEDAQAAIPKGTLLAILISTITYIIMAWMAGSCMLRDAFGEVVIASVNTNESLSALLTTPSVFISGGGEAYNPANSIDALVGYDNIIVEDGISYGINFTTAGMSSFVNGTEVMCAPGECRYGLMNDMQVMQLISGWGPITIAGIISATLSSALASLVSAPKVFQAVCKDKIFPFIYVFAKGYGKGDEPRRAYVLAFVIAVGCICIGDLNAIAPLISNFFLMSYALINYSCFDASLAKSPGWRPAFRFYSMWMSLLGAILCLSVMFVINWWTAVITLALVVFLYVFVHYRKPDINWGSSTQAHVYRSALQHTLKLVSVVDHVKNFRPQVLVLSGYPSDRAPLVDFASNITKNISLLICGDIKLNDEDSGRLNDPRSISRQAYQWLHKRKVKAFYCPVTSNTFRGGAQSLLQCGGLGKMRPNTLLLGFKSDWTSASVEDVETYVNIIHDAFDLRYGVGILRLREGFDHSELTRPQFKITDDFSPCRIDAKIDEADNSRQSREASPKFTGMQLLDVDNKPAEFLDEATTPIKFDGSELQEDEEEPEEEVIEENLMNIDKADKQALKNLNIFYRKQKKGTIDVWWLFDDGGLTLLIPYILSTKKHWGNCKLRVFMAGTKTRELDRDQRHMATLLSKFRIEYSCMTVIPSIGQKPSVQYQNEFKDLIEKWRLNESEGETIETHPWKIDLSELSAQRDKTNRHIRLRELLQEHSRDASLIVMTLPMPRRGLCSTGLYMAWLETLTKDMPPMLLLRGNQDSVLTYYS